MHATSLFDPTDSPPLRLRLFVDDPDETLREFAPAHRTIDPVCLDDPNWTLRRALNRVRTDFPDSRKLETWGQYDTLLGYWESHFGPGPCLSAVTAEELQEFFESVEEWATIRSWKKNSDMLMSLFKSVCRANLKNKEGLPKTIDAPMRSDDIPWVIIPDADWFRKNRTAGKHRTGGHVPKRRSTLTLDQFQIVIDACWSLPGLKDPVWWETLMGWIWFCGMRITQTRTQLLWCLDGESDGIHLESRSIVTKEAKCGGDIVVPIPDSLMPGLSTLWHRKKSADEQNFVFFQSGLRTAAPFYETWDRIWEHAIPCETDAQRRIKHFKPHQMRAVSCTNWDLRPDGDNQVGHLVTGHQPADVRQAVYLQPGDDRWREIIGRFNTELMPTFHCPRPLFI